jgi:TatA/E family protein of Tat protein translocase
MLSLSPLKIFIIVAVVVLLLGPDKLPEVAHKLGSTWQAVRKFQQRVESEVRGALPDLPSSGEIARMARSPINMLNQLADRVENPPGATSPDETPPTSSPLITPVVNPPLAPPPAATGLNSADPSLN